MSAPIPRMGHAPDTDPFHVHRPAEVVLVLRLLANVVVGPPWRPLDRPVLGSTFADRGCARPR